MVIYYFCHSINNNCLSSLLNNLEDKKGQTGHCKEMYVTILFSFGHFVIYWTQSVWTLKYDDCQQVINYVEFDVLDDFW